MSLQQSWSKIWAEPTGKGVVGVGALLILATAAAVSSKNPQSVAPLPSPPTSPNSLPVSSAPSPVPTTPNTDFSTAHAWNSEFNTKALENSIRHESDYKTTGASMSVASASCKPTKTTNVFNCEIRNLGESQPDTSRIEVDIAGNNWASGS